MQKKEGESLFIKPASVFISTTPHTDYCDSINLVATSEEFIMEFGNRNTANPAEVLISKRIALSIFHAKRLSILLSKNIKAYEENFGEIKDTVDRLTAEGRKKFPDRIEKDA